MNRKGSIFDWFFIPVMLLAAVFVMMVIFTVADEINTNMQASDQLGTNAKNVIQKGRDAVGFSDYWFMMIAFGFLIGAMISGYLAPSHPVFYGIMLIPILLSVFLSAEWSNVYSTFSANDALSTAVSNMAMTNTLMTNLPVFVTLGAFGVAILVYSFRRSSGVGF